MIILLDNSKEAEAQRWAWVHQRWIEHGLPERCRCPQCLRKTIEATGEEVEGKR